MLIEQRPGEFVATCEDCGEASAPIESSQEVAVLRLMRSRWRVRTSEGCRQTWCPSCQTASSIPALKIGR